MTIAIDRERGSRQPEVASQTRRLIGAKAVIATTNFWQQEKANVARKFVHGAAGALGAAAVLVPAGLWTGNRLIEHGSQVSKASAFQIGETLVSEADKASNYLDHSQFTQALGGLETLAGGHVSQTQCQTTMTNAANLINNKDPQIYDEFVIKVEPLCAQIASSTASQHAPNRANVDTATTAP